MMTFLSLFTGSAASILHRLLFVGDGGGRNREWNERRLYYKGYGLKEKTNEFQDCTVLQYCILYTTVYSYISDYSYSVRYSGVDL